MTTRMTRPFWRLALTAVIAAAVPAGAQEALTAPKAFFGHDIGADYVLPDYTQFVKYWETLSRQSDRMTLDTIGTTAEGRPQVMAIITSPANRGKIGRYREIAERLARAEGLTDEQARALAAEGKGIVWIDGGLHATEVLGAQQLLETVWQLVSRDDAEIRRFLDDLVILAVHANPDGMELVSDWYMRPSDPKQRSTNTIPRLYQKYIGHDNNRDFYASTQPESENMNRVLYREWYPQIMYNHHQTGPAGTVMFAPPFRDPANYNYHPLIRTQLDLVGASMHNRFVVEDKPGVTMRSGANYSTWWNGGLRTTVYFHNMIGLLTETIGNPTPMEIPFLPNRQLASADLPYPIAPQPWHFRQSIDYSVTANWAVLDVASRHREQFLYNIYKMGSDQIAAGSTDSWTTWPKRIAEVQKAIASERTGEGEGNGNGAARRGGAASAKYYEMLRDPARRDPRGYVIPASQPDFGTATKFVWALQETGIDVHRASSAFTVGGKRYPAGSYVVKTAQAFRAHVLDMFEPQDHPNDFPYEGGPPKPPYDNAGWTLAMQMGVQFDRILDGFDGPFEKLEGMATVPAGTVAEAPNGGGWLLDHRPNDAMLAVNRLLASKAEVYWLRAPLTANGRTYAPGTLYVPASAAARTVVAKLAKEQGLTFDAAAVKAPAGAQKLQARRIGLWDRFGGSMPSGWTRWIMEQFEQPYSVVYAQELDAGNLRAKYDVLVFVDGAIPERDGGAVRPWDAMPGASNVPAEFRSWLGRVSVARTVPQLKRFMEEGGTVITIGSSTILGEHIGLPISNHLMEGSPTAGDKPLGEEKFYVPGSLLEVAVDSTNPAAAGMGSRAIVMYDNSPVFRLGPDAALKGVRPIAWFDTAEPLRSGWAWGQDYLQGGVAAAEADVGRGKLYLYGPEVLFRAQPHGTFKLFFNGIHAGAK